MCFKIAMAKLIIIGGSLATGKSTLAKRLEQETGIKRISMDDLKERLFDIGGFRDRAWSKRIGHIAWPVFQQLVELHLEQGESAIAEATFLWPNDADWLNSLAYRHSVTICQLWMTADPLVARERFIHRSRNERHPGHGDTLERVLEEFDERFFQKRFDPLPLNGKTLVVDTTDFSRVDYGKIISLCATSPIGTFTPNTRARVRRV